jgi:hypothetical protein
VPGPRASLTTVERATEAFAADGCARSKSAMHELQGRDEGYVLPASAGRPQLRGSNSSSAKSLASLDGHMRHMALSRGACTLHLTPLLPRYPCLGTPRRRVHSHAGRGREELEPLSQLSRPPSLLPRRAVGQPAALHGGERGGARWI